ncbi:AIPR family protein [Herbaspirillum sp. VT-16-41]|uniref:AIPR family protein n=1 Tax=Herbaspirillum sp. VT-16-41 TaxID=1953765 RepID=UPI0009809215|nr:AIPR family protein [Herbaspirillum sp. VT-16-41]ONN64983.1 AIPR protein [Herbaspirillum sp. VT-16-41]
MQYQTFIKILDAICAEAPAENKRYHPERGDDEKINQARARAFIHLYLKVMFGETQFVKRERTITDASGDGGIDGYFIDEETKTIHLIQSKFRTTKENFEGKEISLEELLLMDIDRILQGEKNDENGQPYNGKIYQLQREIAEIPDVARYSYRIVILANLRNIPTSKLRVLAGGLPPVVFDFERTYRELVFPVLTGTYFTASDIVIPFDLSNKNAGSKISYNVSTKYGNCEITALFVPTIEIAQVMDKYRNSILQYNPRSYLDLEGHSVNEAIRKTIIESKTNEFALFNNGITMLSEETNINEKIGQKNKAQLRIKNPQIINGGQTSFTLSRIYRDNLENAEQIFQDKEVLLKIITLLEPESDKAKLELIDEISNATNKQTPVITADRFAKETIHIQLQQIVFDKYGLLYERKRGEFSDGVRDGYISASSVIERNHFWRLFYAANGRVNRGFQKRLFQRNDFSDILPIQDSALDRLYLGVNVFQQLRSGMASNARVEKDIYGKVYAYIQLFLEHGLSTDSAVIEKNLVILEEKWREFISSAEARQNTSGHKAYIDRKTGAPLVQFSEIRYIRGTSLERDLVSYFRPKAKISAEIVPNMSEKTD